MRNKNNIKKNFLTTKAIIGIIKFFTMAFPMYITALVLKKQKKFQDIWVISERYNEARDNGFHLFNYINNNTPKKNCFYAIDKNSEDLSRVSKLGDIIYFGSYKHYLFYFMAAKHISAFKQGNGCMPNIYACRLIELLFPVKAKKVYLKHGITHNYLKALEKDKSNLDLVISGALPEYVYLKNNFGYKDEEVQYLGLARFDALINSKTKGRKILYMPTWRRWLNNANDKQFIKSEYYMMIQSLLENQNLISLFEQYNIELTLCLHPFCQKFRHLFYSENKNIKIANISEKGVQTRLKESSLLITDYSSVYFDFAYMNKAIIYYQFDSNRFKNNHYPEGFFNYQNDGFGPIVSTEKDLVEEIKILIKNDMLLNEKYSRRISSFFPLRDDNNCKRNYESIQNL